MLPNPSSFPGVFVLRRPDIATVTLGMRASRRTVQRCCQRHGAGTVQGSRLGTAAFCTPRVSAGPFILRAGESRDHRVRLPASAPEQTQIHSSKINFLSGIAWLLCVLACRYILGQICQLFHAPRTWGQFAELSIDIQMVRFGKNVNKLKIKLHNINP